MRTIVCPVCGEKGPNYDRINEHWSVCMWCSAVYCYPAVIISGGKCEHINGKKVPEFEQYAIGYINVFEGNGIVHKRFPEKTHVTMCVDNKCSVCGEPIEMDGF